MKRKVKVTFPKAKKGLEARTSGLEIRMAPGLGYNANQLNWPVMAGEFSAPDIETNSTLKPVPRDEANLEAEVGETAVTDLNGDGLPEHYKIGGKRHYDGGTPLYLPDNSFIFSRDRSMKIKDPKVLKSFGMPERKGGYTPADIAKKYDINKFRKILADPNTDDIQRKTAESMIASYNIKLGKLAIIQESMKGFPQGIPVIAMPYLEATGIDPKTLINGPEQPGQETEQQQDEDENSLAAPPEETEAEEEQPAPDQARYGMNIISQLQMRKQGGDLTKFTGGGLKRKVKVSFPKFQTGGTQTTGKAVAPPASNVTKYDSEDAIYADPNYKTLVANGAAYLKQPDGKYKKITYVPPKPPKEAFDDRLGNYKDEYAYLYSEMANSDVQKAIVTKYQERVNALPDSDPNKKALMAKTPEDIINDFMQLQRQNFAIQNQGGKQLGEQAWKNKSNPEKAYADAMKKAGFDPLDRETTASGQMAYAAFLDATNDDSTKELFKGINPEQKGEPDESFYQGNKKVSPVDGIYGDTTAGQLATPTKITVSNDEPSGDAVVKKPSAKHLGPQPPEGGANFWIQDIIKTLGAVGDWARTKKHMPWQAPLDLKKPDVILASPERELAAGEEQANVLTGALSAFSGPQALSSRASQIQGQRAKEAADVLSRYTNLNVGLLNQNEQERTSIINQEAGMKQQLATNLYDKVTTVNQEFDNTKLAREQNMREQFVNAITNRAYTYNMNSLFPQYATSPLSGGMIDFTHGAPITPESGDEQTVADIYETIRQQHPSIDPKQAVELAKLQAGVKSDSGNSLLKDFLSSAGYQG